MTTPTANLIEIFSAIQGEGLDVGARQLFLRFARCDLRCHFCDSAHTWDVPSTCRVEKTPGERDFETRDNPVELATLLEWARRLHFPGSHDAVSITGGEPLLQAEFLREFLPRLRDATGLPIYLETGGHRPRELSLVLPYLDSVGMDIKLPSVSGERRWAAHADFLQRCRDASVVVFVKLIISDRSDPAELERAASLVATIDPEIPAFLQPATPLPEPLPAGPVSPPTAERVLAWQTLMKRSLASVRVVPQTHKTLGQL